MAQNISHKLDGLTVCFSGTVGVFVGLSDGGVLMIGHQGIEWDSRWLELGNGLDNVELHSA